MREAQVGEVGADQVGGADQVEGADQAGGADQVGQGIKAEVGGGAGAEAAATTKEKM